MIKIQTPPRAARTLFFRLRAGLLYLPLAALFSCSSSPASAQDPPLPVPAGYPEYAFLHPELNMIQFYDRAALDTFYARWKETKTRKLSMVHTGDSHCQSDIFPGRVRKNLQEVHGDGGRGMMFPYSTAKTYSSVEYSTKHTGEWTYAKSLAVPPKIPLGVSGMTCKTTVAGSSFTFTFKTPVPAHYTKLRIYCKKQHNSYNLLVECGGKSIPVDVDSTQNGLPYYEIDLPPIGTDLKFRVTKSGPHEKELEFYGCSLESANNTGIILHNVGVGGARYESILYEELFDEQLPTLNPDVVIIDFGTNDYLYDDSLKANLESTIHKVITRVQESAPNASIILTSTMDMYRRGGHVTRGEFFSDLIHKVARERKCGVYDWYWIAGGWNAMPKWQDKSLGQPDGIHLTMSGYRLKGNLFSEAMINTVAWMDEHPGGDSLVFRLDSLKQVDHILRFKEDSARIAGGGVAGKTKVVHKIRNGETLGGIARKYGVTTSQIKKWNNLKSDRIYAGKTLIIYTNKRRR